MWKQHREEVGDVPPNVRITRFMPQVDLLADPRVRAFVSHCGRNSLKFWCGCVESDGKC